MKSKASRSTGSEQDQQSPPDRDAPRCVRCGSPAVFGDEASRVYACERCMNDEEIRLYPWAPPVYMLAFLTREATGDFHGLSMERRVTAYFAAQLANDLLVFAEVLNDPTAPAEDVKYALEDVHMLRKAAYRRDTANMATMHAITSVFRCAETKPDANGVVDWKRAIDRALEDLATWQPWLKIKREDFVAAVDARRTNVRVWQAIIRMLGIEQKPETLRKEFTRWSVGPFAFGHFDSRGPYPVSMPERPPRARRPRRPLH